ncbi:SDR family oxidoreductase [Aciditerrimonas ferrireducens]|uniref:SDR family oxidoreductase n=1 Tax=Aciditerrimonas ferrireducens TaxID=667306 RepID=A0ABV6BZQ4_9ACTN
MARTPADPFLGATAIVTGGASGIGKALTAALLERGAAVTVADIDEAALEQVDRELGPGAGERLSTRRLDVTDLGAFEQLVEEVAEERVHLDYLFNNAGIAVAGDAARLTPAHWDRVLAVNLKGVVNGVLAAYPRMVRQGAGHLVNTASLAGLVPSPTLTPYAMTKHAVVGLSVSLRAEAAAYGVKVTAVCPGFVDTPLLDRVNPGLPSVGGRQPGRDLLRRLPGGLYTTDRLATDVLAGVARNRPLVVAPASARAAWWAWRATPRGWLGAAALGTRRVLRELAG